MASSTPMQRVVVRVLAMVAVGWIGAACSGTPRIRIEAPEARLSPMLVGVCSVFMRIANPGDGADALVDAQVEVPGATAQIHAIRDGKMVRDDRLIVPAGGVLELAPGGLHIMVFNLPKGTGAGYEFTLRLRFETSGERRTSVRISG